MINLSFSEEEVRRLYAALKYRADEDDPLVKTLAFALTAKPKQWRIVVRYDDPRGGIWRGPLEDRASALARAESESAIVRGSVTLEQV